MPKVTIDGRQVEVEPGTTVIRAAASLGIDIPYFCWHPRLSVAANCRMCLVEVEGAPKLLPSCEVVCRDGMVVHTGTPKVLEARAAVMQFILINHPIDCPICDQAGECKLQDYYMEHDQAGSAFVETKVAKDKTVVLGPTVVLDQERCINCTRCVRFMKEVAGDPQLGQFERGDRAAIGVFPGTELDDPYSANVADICPVGALTYRDFRFKKRSWFLKHTDSVCPGCARGCSTRIDHEGNVVHRLKPRDNDFVNKGWLCDEGRLTYHRIHDPDSQITEPHERVDGKLVPIGWDRARLVIAEKLSGFVGESDGTLGLCLSASITTEGATAFVELAEQVLQVDTYAIVGGPDGEGDSLLRVADRNPNRAGCELVLEAYSIYDEGPQALLRALDSGTVKTLVMVGTEYPEPNDKWLAALRGTEAVLAFTSNWDATAGQADLVIPMTTYAEQDGTFVNVGGRMQRIHRALDPIGRRKGTVETAAITAAALGSGGGWKIDNWITAFNHLKRRTELLRDVKPLELGPWGVALDADDLPEGPSRYEIVTESAGAGASV